MSRNNVMKWDELNIIREDARILFRGQKKPSRQQMQDFCDYLDFILCLIYAYGWKDAEEIVGPVLFETGLDDKAVHQLIDGKDFRDRVFETQTAEEVIRIIDTEAHRDYNTGVIDAARRSGKSNLRKTWYTMLDDKVRDSHRYLEGMTVGLDDLFYTDDGDVAMFPGDFADPANNVNCRCFVMLSA